MTLTRMAMVPPALLAACLVASVLPSAVAAQDSGKRGAAAAQSAGGSGGKNGGGDKGGSDVSTSSLFGFTDGSDTDGAGEHGAALDTQVAAGKGSGRFVGIRNKLEYGRAWTDDFSLSLAAIGSGQYVRGVEGLDDTRGYGIGAVSAEVTYRFLDRQKNPFGVAVKIEPGIGWRDETTGEGMFGFGVENKLIIDRELIKGRFYAAFNLIYAPSVERASGSTRWSDGGEWGAALAGTLQLTPKAFLGAEARYLRAHEGLGFGALEGQALYVGPTAYLAVTDQLSLVAAWNVQVWGWEAGGSGALDLVNYERHLFRLKASLGF